MSEDDALFRAVVASPEDADARLVYADWLDDRTGGRASERNRRGDMNPTDDRRESLAAKGRRLYGKFCGTGGRGICAESFAVYHIGRGEPCVAEDLAAYLDGVAAELEASDPDGRLGATRGLAARIRSHLAVQSATLPHTGPALRRFVLDGANEPVEVRRVAGLSDDALEPLVTDSEAAGWKMVRRLADELRTGANRFDRPGEALFAAVAGESLVGVCGLNADPFLAEPVVGRVRRLYVMRARRGSGVGGELVRAVVSAAAGHFRRLRVRTENAAAGRVYERVGFRSVAGEPDCTHALELV